MKLFPEFQPQSRVWIYQSSKEFSAEQKQTFNELKRTFLENWESHGSPVQGKVELLHNRFIVVAINEADERSCGRSVDSSVRFMKELETELGVTLLDRMQVAYKKGDKIFSCGLSEFEKLARTGEVNKDTVVFDNSIHSLTELETKWEVTAGKSWHSRVLI